MAEFDNSYRVGCWEINTLSAIIFLYPGDVAVLKELAWEVIQTIFNSAKLQQPGFLEDPNTKQVLYTLEPIFRSIISGNDGVDSGGSQSVTGKDALQKLRFCFAEQLPQISTALKECGGNMKVEI